MKKGFLLFSALFLLAATGVFAKVTAKQEGGVVKVTWTYTAPDASFVGLVGDFQGWNLGGATPMVKDANGVWSVTLDLTPTSEVKYKFNVDDEWTEDPEAPLGTDDGFGGTNGYVIVADLLAAGASGGTAAAAPAARGLTVGLFHAAWLRAGFVTENPQENDKKGFALDQISLHNKAYFKFDGTVYANLLTAAGEIQLFDGAVNVYKVESKFDAVENAFVAQETTTLEQGFKNLLVLPWTSFQSFGATWPVIKGKFRTTLDLADLNLKVSHSVGWSKTAKQNQGLYFSEIWGEPDANDGITEVYSGKAIDLGGASLEYLVNFVSTLKNNVYATVKAGDLTAELGINLNSNATDIAEYATNLWQRYALGVGYMAGDLSTTAQFSYALKNGATLEDTLFAGASVQMKNLGPATVYADFRFAGANASTGYADGDDNIDNSARSKVRVDLALGDITAFVENNLNAAVDFATMTDTVTLGSTITAGSIKITPEVKMTVMEEFALNHIQIGAVVDALTATLKYLPSADFATSTIKLSGTYALDATSGLAFALATTLDDNDTNNMFGLTLGYNLKTPFDAVKNPFLFATFDYNMNAMDGDDNYVLKGIDDIGIGTGAALRAGLRWNW